MTDDRNHHEEALLHRLAEQSARRQGHGPNADADALTDSELEAFAEDRLGAKQGREIAGRLAKDPEARRRLLELRGVDPGGPSPALRRRVLASATRLPARRGWARPAVAALAAVLLVALGWGVLQKRTLPSGLEYDVRVQGASEIRDGGAAPRLIAGVETRLRFDVTPKDVAEREVEFALYRRVDREPPPARVERVPPEQIAATIERGAATLRVRAGDLFDEMPGTYPVWIVVARPGDLPAAMDLRSGVSPTEILAADGRRRVYPSVVEIVIDPLAP